MHFAIGRPKLSIGRPIYMGKCISENTAVSCTTFCFTTAKTVGIGRPMLNFGRPIVNCTPKLQGLPYLIVSGVWRDYQILHICATFTRNHLISSTSRRPPNHVPAVPGIRAQRTMPPQPPRPPEVVRGGVDRPRDGCGLAHEQQHRATVNFVLFSGHFRDETSCKFTAVQLCGYYDGHATVRIVGTRYTSPARAS